MKFGKKEVIIYYGGSVNDLAKVDIHNKKVLELGYFDKSDGFSFFKEKWSSEAETQNILMNEEYLAEDILETAEKYYEEGLNLKQQYMQENFSKLLENSGVSSRIAKGENIEDLFYRYDKKFVSLTNLEKKEAEYKNNSDYIDKEVKENLLSAEYNFLGLDEEAFREFFNNLEVSKKDDEYIFKLNGEEIASNCHYEEAFISAVNIFLKNNEKFHSVALLNDINIESYSSGEWTSEDFMILGEKDVTYDLKNIGYPTSDIDYLAYFDGRLSVKTDIDDIDDIDDDVIGNIKESAWNLALDDFWNENYEDYASIFANINSFLKENDKDNTLAIVTRKGKDFYLVPNYVYLDDYNNPISVVLEKKVPSELIEKTKSFLDSLKMGLSNQIKETIEEEYKNLTAENNYHTI